MAKEVDVKVRYIPDTSALKSALSGAQKVDFKISGGDVKKELLTPVQNAMREVNKALSSGADSKTLLKLFQDVGKAADTAKTQASGMLSELNSVFSSAGNQQLLKDLQGYEKELKKAQKEIDNWEKKYSNKALGEMKTTAGVTGIAEARNVKKELEEQLATSKKLTAEDEARLEAINKYLQAWDERRNTKTRAELETDYKKIETDRNAVLEQAQLPSFNASSTKELTAIINQLGQMAGLSSQEINKLTASIKAEDAAAENANKENKKEALRLADIVTGTFLGTNISSLFTSALQRGVQFFKEYDEVLTRTMMVTGQTREEVTSLTDSYNKLANQLSSTTKDVAAAQLVFYQQGLGTQEALKMTEASIAISKTGGIEAGEAANRLTAAVRGYQLAANDAMSIADKMSALDAAAASSVDELTIAMQKSASQARMAGLDLDYYMAYLSTMQEVTREAPENIGTAMKSITSRLQEITDLGKVEEDGTTFSNVAKALNSVGIAAVDSAGQLRNLQDIMNELGPMWATLDRNHKAYLATTLAGNRQQSRFIALMDNYDRAMELVNVSQNASGESAKQLRAYNQGLEASFVRLSNAWQQFATRVADSDMIKGVIDLLADLVEMLNKIPKPITQTIIPLTALIKGFQLFSNAGNLFNQFKGGLVKKLGIDTLKSEVASMNGIFGSSISTVTKWGQSIKRAFDGFGNDKYAEYNNAIQTNNALLDVNNAKTSITASLKNSEVASSGKLKTASDVLTNSYNLLNDAIARNEKVLQANDDEMLLEANDDYRTAKANLNMTNSTLKTLAEQHGQVQTRGQDEINALWKKHNTVSESNSRRKIANYLKDKEGMSSDQIKKISNADWKKYLGSLAEEADEYDLEITQKKAENIDKIIQDKLKDINKHSEELEEYAQNLNKQIAGYRQQAGLPTMMEDPLPKSPLESFKEAKSVSMGDIKNLFTSDATKGIGNIDKISAVFGKLNITSGLIAGSLTQMGASFLGLDDDMSSALSTSVGLATTFAKFAPPWGAIIGASIGVIKFAFDKMYPSVEETQKKITELQQEMDGLSQKKDDIANSLQVYEELSGKLDKTDEETQQLKDSTEQLVSLVPGAVVGYNQYGEAIINVAAAYDELDKKQREMSANADKQLTEFDNLQKGAQKTAKTWNTINKVAGWALAIGGTIAAPFTGGASLGATALGVGMIGGGAAADQVIDEKQIEENRKVWDENYSEILKAYQIKRDEFLIDVSDQNKDTASKVIDSMISSLMEAGRNGRIEDATGAITDMLSKYENISWSEINSAMSRVALKGDYTNLSFGEAREEMEKRIKQSLKDAGLTDNEIEMTITAMLNISWDGAADVEALKKEIDTQIEKLRNGGGDQSRINILESFKKGLDELDQAELKLLKDSGMLDVAFADVFEKNGGVKYSVSKFKDVNGELNSSKMILNTINSLYNEQEEKQKKIAEYQELNSKEEERYHQTMRKIAEDDFNSQMPSYKANYNDEEKEAWIKRQQEYYEGLDFEGDDSYMEDDTFYTQRAAKAQKEYNNALDDNNKLIKEAERDIGEYLDNIDEMIGTVESYKEPTFGEMADSLNKIKDSFDEIVSLAESLKKSDGKFSFGDVSDLFSILDGYEQMINLQDTASLSTQTYYDALGKINNAVQVQNGYLVAQEGLEEGLNQLAIASAQAKMQELYIQLEQSEAELNYQNAILTTEKAAVDAALEELKSKREKADVSSKLENTQATLEANLAAVSVSTEESKLNAKLELVADYAQKYAKLMREAEKGEFDGSIEKVNANIDKLKSKMAETINNSVKDLVDMDDIDGSIAALEKRSNALQTQIDNNNNAIENSIGLKKKIAEYLKDPKNIGNTAQVQGIKDAAEAQKDYNEKLERTLTLLEKIQGLQHTIDENETFKDLYKDYSGEDYGRLLMQNLELAKQQYGVYKDLFALQQEMTDQAAGDLLDSPYGQLFKIMENGDIGWSSDSAFFAYKNMSEEAQEDIDNLVDAYQKERDALRDTEKELAKYAQEEKKVREELVAMEIEIENELVDALKNREKILNDARQKALDDEIKMIEEAVEKRKKAREDEADNKELYEAQEALRRATLDSSGKNNASLLQLQQDLEDKQLEISEKRFEDDMDDRKQWLQDTKDAEQETYEYRLETMTWYWEQVQIIQESGTEAMMEALIHWNEEYRVQSELQQEEMERHWRETMDAMKAATDMGAELGQLTTDIVDVTQHVESMNVSIDKLPGTWQRATDAANAYAAAARAAASYNYGGGGGSISTGGGGTTTTTTKKDAPKEKYTGSMKKGDKIEFKPEGGNGTRVNTYSKDGTTNGSIDDPWGYDRNYKAGNIKKIKGEWMVDIGGGQYVPVRHFQKPGGWGSGTRFASGGIVDYTGPAWVDGNKAHPEAFLNPYQTKQIGALASALDTNNVNNVSSDSNITFGSISFNVASMSSAEDGKKALDAFVKGANDMMAKKGIGTKINLNMK